MPAPIVILDRDGVINQGTDGMIKSPSEWHAIPGSLPAIARLSQSGYRVLIATNQSGLARRLLTIEDFLVINQTMLNHLAQYGGNIEAIFFCPCGPRDKDCNCHKPKPGLLLDIAQRLRISLQGVPYVGDKLPDIQAARAAGAQPVLVRTGGGEELVLKNKVPKGVPVHVNLAGFVVDLLGSG